MLTNYHMHSTFSDGKNAPEEIVVAAIEKGFSAIGFSDHGYTSYDLRYCMKDVDGYIQEIQRLKEKYKKQIQIYLGVEEDSRALVDRSKFDYIIGSCHYVNVKSKEYPLDSNYSYFSKCLELFEGNPLALAEYYYQNFCSYIVQRRPEVIGHFDLPTKFDETKKNRFLGNTGYWKIAEKYTLEALRTQCIFEVNTGLMARGYRTNPCPHERLLYLILKNGGEVTLSSDSHQIETLDSRFLEVKKLLKDIGFSNIRVLYNGEWIKESI